MAGDAASAHAVRHPAPHRTRAGLGAQLFGLAGAPAVWFAHLLVNYGVASHACYPGAAPRGAPGAGWGWVWPVMLASNLMALGAAVAAGVVAWRIWRLVRAEARGHDGRLVQAGEGRTRFLAACGMMTSAAFFAASAFNLGAFLVLPLCR